MDQINHILPSNSVSETEPTIKNPTTSRPVPTFDSFVSMIESFTQLPTPLPYIEPEAEPGPVTYFGTFDNFEGNEHDQVQLDTVDQFFGLGLESGFEGGQSLYDIDDKALLPVSGYDHLPINTNPNTQFDSSSPIDQFSHTDTPLQQIDTYSPIDQFAHTEYTLPPPPSFPTNFDQSTFPTAVDLISFPVNTQGPQPEHLAVSPTGHWTPITPTSQLPSQGLSYLHDPFPLPQVQVPQYIQDHTPTLAPHYLDYELDLEMTNDPFQPHYSWDEIRTVTPISTTDHRPIVSCRPTMKFSLPSALGDSVHDPETFGLKAEPIGGVDDGVRFPTSGQRWNTHLPTPLITDWKDDGPNSNVPTPRSFWRDVDGRERPNLNVDNGGGNGLAKPSIQNSLFETRDQHQQSFTESRPLVHNNAQGPGNGQGGRQIDTPLFGFSRGAYLARSLAPQKIHPKPIHTHPPSLNHHHHLSSFSQPPPHTYNPNPNSMSSSEYYPPSPITSYHPPSQHGNPVLPGVHHLFDHHHQVNSHAHTASPSTIFPNAKQYSHPIDIHHQPPDPRRDVRSFQDTRVENYNVGMNGQESRDVESTSPDHISIVSRTSSESVESFESEEGEGGDDFEEVLSEYKPGKTNKSKTKSKDKSKSKEKTKSKGKDQSRNMEKNQENNVIKGLKKHSEIVMKKMDIERERGQKVPQKVQGRSMVGYEFIWEGGVAYTDDAELKQTREVRRRCHNCDTRSPPSWRKSNLVPGKILCNKCGIYERTHNKPRPQQQDEMKLRRNPTPPPSLGGYEPLEYDDDDDDEDDNEEELESSPVSQYSHIDTDQISSHVIDNTGNASTSPHPEDVEMEVGIIERPQFEESICRDERSQITPVSVSDSPPSPLIQIVQPFPLLFLPPTTQASVNEIISFSQSQPQSFLNLNAPLDTDSRQLPPLRTVTSYWNSQPTSGSGSVVPSPTTPSTGNGSGIIDSIANRNGNGSGNGNGWAGKIALTPYSRPGSRSDLRSASTSSTSLRGVDSGRW